MDCVEPNSEKEAPSGNPLKVYSRRRKGPTPHLSQLELKDSLENEADTKPDSDLLLDVPIAI